MIREVLVQTTDYHVRTDYHVQVNSCFAENLKHAVDGHLNRYLRLWPLQPLSSRSKCMTTCVCVGAFQSQSVREEGQEEGEAENPYAAELGGMRSVRVKVQRCGKENIRNRNM